MKSLISVNYKFMSLTPSYLVELILKSKYTKGIEIYINYDSNEEKEYLNNLVFELKKNNLVLQIHGEILLEYNKQIEFIKILEKYSDYLNIPIVLTFHTIYNDNKDISLKQTIDYISKIINSIDNNKIVVCLENLNDTGDFVRLGKEELKTTILNDERLYFTYDIGHEIADSGKITNLDRDIFEDIRNVHIHSIDNKGVDHIPIYEGGYHWNEIVKGLDFLMLNKYKYNIVYEYGLEYCKGNSVEEKIEDYLKSVDSISEKYENSTYE